MRSALLAVAAIAVSLSSCDKDAVEKTSKEFLTTDKWYLEQADVYGSINGENYSQRLTGFIPYCMEDNALSFLPDGTVSMEEGLNVCEGSSNTANLGGWQLSEDGRAFSASLPGLPQAAVFQVTELDARYFKIRWQGAYLNTAATFEAIYSHKH